LTSLEERLPAHSCEAHDSTTKGSRNYSTCSHDDEWLGLDATRHSHTGSSHATFLRSLCVLLGSCDAQIRNHTPKAHILIFMSAKTRNQPMAFGLASRGLSLVTVSRRTRSRDATLEARRVRTRMLKGNFCIISRSIQRCVYDIRMDG
jgi:hypothetical protein